MRPAAMRSPADDAVATTPAARPCVPPPADVHALLVREDIADTCRRFGMRCVARLVLVATTREEWGDARGDIAVARANARQDDRAELEAARNAALAMETGGVETAIGHLAAHCGLTVEVWISRTADEVDARISSEAAARLGRL